MRAHFRLEAIVQDVVHALRGIRRAPGFAAAALLTLALGIGAATAIFSVAYGVLLRPLPFPAADRMVEVSVDLSGVGDSYGSFSAPEFVDLTRANRSFTAIAAWSLRPRTLGMHDAPVRVSGAQTTAALWQVLGVRAAIGRVYTPEEDVPGARLVTVLSHDLWRRSFGGDSSIVGRAIQVDGIARTVVGVLPPEVRMSGIEVYTPVAMNMNQLPGRGAHFLSVLGRLRPGVTIEQARAEMMEFAKRSVRDNPTNYLTQFTSTVRPVREAWFGRAAPTMKALLATVILLLLLAAVNVANLLLVRAESRQREMGVRVALGAQRGRLVRQLLTESVTLAVLGAAIGVPLAALAVRSLLVINPGVIPPGAEVAIDAGVFGAVIGVVALAALVAGIIPALRAGATDVRTAIAVGGSGGGRSGGRLRSTLVVTQVAIAAAMLVGAGVVGRSLAKLLSVDPGFSAENTMVMTISLPRVKYDSAHKIIAFHDQTLARLRALPGVRAAATTSTVPLGTGTSSWSVEIEGRPNSARDMETPFFVVGTTDVFRAMGISVVRGRAFTAEDVESAPPTAVVSETMAREVWRGQDAIGRRFRLSGPDLPWVTVVGIARDVRPVSLSEQPKQTYYLLLPQFARMNGFADAGATWVLRTAPGIDPMSIAASARGIVHEMDPALAPYNVQTLESVVTASVAQPRFAASLLTAFGGAALLLAVIGVYGVLSYAFARRRRELAVRIAMGAPLGDVRRLVLGSGLRLAAVGIVAGLGVAIVGGRLLEKLLFEVTATDPPTLAAVTVTLLGAAALASWVPARRATSVNPAEVLRGE